MDPDALLNAPWGFEGLYESINLHPLFVHFPVALLSAALVFYAIGSIVRNEGLFHAGKWSLLAGTAGAAAAVWSGLIAEETVPHDASVHHLIEAHEALGVLILGLSVLLSVWLLISRSSLPQKGRPLFFAALALAALLIAQTGDFGGRMVYMHGLGMGKRSALPRMHAPHVHEHVHDHEH